jgi:hypothetical protein
MSALLEETPNATRAQLDGRYPDGFDLSQAQIEAIQLEGVARRFAELRPRVAVLNRFATELGVHHIGSIEEVTKVLFPHTIYKSYPLEWIECGDFERLTNWLAGLTTCALQPGQYRDAKTLDGWIDALDQRTELRVAHTFGTTGKLSLIPRSHEEWLCGASRIARCIRDWNGLGSGPDLAAERLPIVQPFYRLGASAVNRGVASMVELFGGGEPAYYLYPEGRLSADVISLAGRTRSTGTAQSLNSPELRHKREEFRRLVQERPKRLDEFTDHVRQCLGSRDVYLLGVWPTLLDWAQLGVGRGLRGIFGRGSILHTGGGTKGRVMPPNWRRTVHEFLGFDRSYEFYTMTELIPACPRCPAGNYHVPTALVPFVLDPRTGVPYPREGRHTGRFAFLDLLATTYWSGLVTGDELTLVGGSKRCVCGRHGFYIEPDIRRYDAAQGGDDKVSCAGTEEAYQYALAELVGGTDERSRARA